MGFDQWLESLGYAVVGNEEDGKRYFAPTSDGMRRVGGRSGDNSTSELDQLRAQYNSTLMDPQGRPIYGTSGYNFEPESGNLPINGMSQVDPSQYTPEVINAAAQYGINLTPQYDPQYGYVIPQQNLERWANIISPESWFDKYGPALIQGAAMGGVGLYNAGLGAAGGGAGWTSGYDLPMGNDLLSMTGSVGIPAVVNVTAMAAPEVGGTFNGINAGGSLGLNPGGTGLGFGPEFGSSISAIPPAAIAPSSVLPASLAGPVAAALAAGAAGGAGSALGSAVTGAATSAATKSALDRIIGGISDGNWGEALGGLGQGAMSLGPSLAAINYARNQDPFNTSNLQSLYSQTPTNYQFDTSKLNAAYDAFDPNSVTKQYDLNTGQGRGALADSLAARGVAGSSFGSYDMANYGVQRDAGRQSLINDAIMKRAGIADTLLSNDRQTAALNLQGLNAKAGLANSILGADVKDREMRNNLYGRALLALSGGLSPSKQALW